jgi:hypothetical protein
MAGNAFLGRARLNPLSHHPVYVRFVMVKLSPKQPQTVAELRAIIDAAKVQAKAKFARDWRGLSPREAMKLATDNAHLFKARGSAPT